MKIAGETPRFELVPVEPGPTVSRSTVAAGAGDAPGVTFRKVFHGLGKAVDGGEALVARAASGDLGGLDSAELIALQAGIYRYSEAVDLVGKVVDRVSSAVRTVVSPHS